MKPTSLCVAGRLPARGGSARPGLSNIRLALLPRPRLVITMAYILTDTTTTACLTIPYPQHAHHHHPHPGVHHQAPTHAGPVSHQHHVQTTDIKHTTVAASSAGTTAPNPSSPAFFSARASSNERENCSIHGVSHHPTTYEPSDHACVNVRSQGAIPFDAAASFQQHRERRRPCDPSGGVPSERGPGLEQPLNLWRTQPQRASSQPRTFSLSSTTPPITARATILVRTITAAILPHPNVGVVQKEARRTGRREPPAGMSILKSSLCGQGPAPAVPALRAYPFTVPDATATWSDNPTAIPKEPTSDLYQEITTAGNTVLPTTLADVSVSIPRDQTRATVSTSAAATQLAESSTTTPVPASNGPAATTYSPASDTVSTQSAVPSTTSVVPTTVRSPTSLKVTQTALPAATDTSTQPPAVESTSVVPEATPDAAPSGTVSFTTTSHRFI
ncbi:hypothetical protein MTO96_037978 [Rhipicephalus appendiculatus]